MVVILKSSTKVCLQALRNLKYNEKQMEEIVNYAKGHATLKGAPYINDSFIAGEKGFLPAENRQARMHLMASAFEIGFVFNVYTLGEACIQRLGFAAAQYNDFGWSLLEALGFKDEEIDAANIYICGTMTVEGAPYLKDEHLSVFDCANKCGAKRRTLYTCTWPYPYDGCSTTILKWCHQQNHQPAK